MRPKSIVNFERIVILSILFGIVSSFLTREKMEAMTAGKPHLSSGATLAIQIVVILIYLLLIYFISRKGSPVAKWIYVVLCLLGLVGGVFTLPLLMKIGTLPLIIAIVQYVLAILSLWLLFRPDSKAWFSEGRTADPADLR
ncbi:MAG: hypothetical protein JWO81_2581 [Alphaproteobacteria bacterium]|nr:hypothetical protein [Alphaproteobacteria bacterium]